MLVSNVVVGVSKARRLARLAARARVGVCVDSVLQIEQLAAAAREEGSTIELLIEADVGAARCGVTDADEALVLARAIHAHRPNLVLRGLQAYQGSAQHLRSVQERAVAIGLAAARAARIASALRAAGYPVEEISGGGTGTYPYELASEVYTEVQPGSYVLMDTDYGANQHDPDVPVLAQALGVWCTVITSRPGHAVLDGGLKTFAVDSGLPEGARAGLEDPRVVRRAHGDRAAGAGARAEGRRKAQAGAGTLRPDGQPARLARRASRRARRGSLGDRCAGCAILTGRADRSGRPERSGRAGQQARVRGRASTGALSAPGLSGNER